MNEQKCKQLIGQDLSNARGLCDALLNEIDEAELVDVHDQLDRIMRCMTDAKSRLKNCEDY